jgi:membrane protein
LVPVQVLGHHKTTTSMRNRMVNLWTLGGLSLPDLLRRTALASWQDEVFGQGGRMAFYHFLAIFPSLLVFFIVSARVPHLGDHMRTALQEMSRQVLPDQVSQLIQNVMEELNQRARSGVQLFSVCAGALWAAFNGTWAMIYGLNKAYEVEENRSWWELAITIIGLTLSLAVTGSIAVLMIFCSAYLRARFHGGAIALHCLEWLVLAASLSVSFALLYRFAPNLRDCEWRWSTPGAFCALVLWIGSTFAARVYFDHVDYARSYGQLSGVVMLLLWLYVTNGAILIGGEMNSEIEKTVTGRRDTSAGVHLQDHSDPTKSTLSAVKP